MSTILVVYGTRPEALKLAGIVSLAREKGLDVRTVCTNQSRDLYPDRILTPDFVVPIGTLPDSLLPPALVVVQGDTRTAFCAAVRAYELGIPVFHVEAGVRTYDLKNPWPEEGYRQMISRIATYHACSTLQSYFNLEDERLIRNTYDHSREPIGLSQNASVTGNPIVESVRRRAMEEIDYQWPCNDRRRVLVTLHRRETAGQFSSVWEGVVAGLEGIAHEMMWPIHPNKLAQAGAPGWAWDRAVPPLSPIAFANALDDCDLLITDSGGNQEEANALGVPCVVTRDVTDRPESLGRGGAFLGGRTAETLVPAIHAALAMDRTTIDRSIFGDGTASQQIVDWLAEIVATNV
jgi:UDP-N-acetylglucosamine 2-epimerase (non-hydrolysing)